MGFPSSSLSDSTVQAVARIKIRISLLAVESVEECRECRERHEFKSMYKKEEGKKTPEKTKISDLSRLEVWREDYRLRRESRIECECHGS
jgi:hypothetical protein